MMGSGMIYCPVILIVFVLKPRGCCNAPVLFPTRIKWNDRGDQCSDVGQFNPHGIHITCTSTFRKWGCLDYEYHKQQRCCRRSCRLGAPRRMCLKWGMPTENDDRSSIKSWRISIDIATGERNQFHGDSCATVYGDW